MYIMKCVTWCHRIQLRQGTFSMNPFSLVNGSDIMYALTCHHNAYLNSSSFIIPSFQDVLCAFGHKLEFEEMTFCILTFTSL